MTHSLLMLFALEVGVIERLEAVLGMLLWA